MKKYYKDYKLVSKTLPSGRVKQVAEYIGKYYICQLSETNLRRYKSYYFALVLCSCTTAIGAGFINNPGSRIAYVALPHVSLFLPMVYNFIGTIGFMTSKSKLERGTYYKTKIRIRRSTIWQIILSSMAILGDIIYMIYGLDGNSVQKELVFTVCMVLILVINLIYLQLQKRVVYQVEDPYYKE
ncbi:MAG: hypothetical protein GX237_02080 [Clostridiales bacterium]|nr:hypothetical protein [Clostridiales bacterium]